MTIEEQLRKEWEESEVAKRIVSVESLAITTGHATQWYGETVPDFIVKTVNRILQERADAIRGEEVEEDEAKFADDPDNKLSEGYSIGYNQALETAALLVEEGISSKKD